MKGRDTQEFTAALALGIVLGAAVAILVRRSEPGVPWPWVG